MKFIDSHSHIYSEDFDKDFEDAINRAKEAGIEKILMPDIDSSTRRRMLDAHSKYPQYLIPMLGIHPTSINENYKQEVNCLEKALKDNDICAIGEIGIDLYWDKTFIKEQIKAFEYQIAIAEEMKLPISIHSRESMQEVLKIISKFNSVIGVLHCFPGDTEDAKRAIDMGYLLGIGGVVTFKNSQTAKVISEIGIQNIILETDSPYLSPSPLRGKRNESANIRIIAEKIAELTNISLKDVAEITRNNTIKLFNP